MKDSTPSILNELIDSLKCLPGVGPKSAQRMAYHLLQRDQKGARRLAFSLNMALDGLKQCKRCNNYSDTEVCELCLDADRDATKLCVVEMPADLNRMEQAKCHSGLYYVLQGKISPLDGIGPDDIQIDRLLTRAKDGIVEEVILATNYTAEGEATAYYISEMLKRSSILVTRISRGMPVGGELEYVDTGTLAQSVYERKTL
ncbi:recombination mediator RecR [Leeia sp. TBRC 13508]|uniref:Recombination protein RecR n=1 Tax=Leeia speluncae TaxID=2884804 RepID=A0ABS8D2L6_9NEIS|nr:recombination mediator RecR [Leeia speluncae]MCB6182432.1 recombination mediator RecR [Leeia speluncae]